MTEKDLIIIGAGYIAGFLVNNQELFNEKYNIIGFLDDDPKKTGKKYWDIPVLGSIDDLANYNGVSVVIGIAAPKIKVQILKRINVADYHFPNFVSRNVWISNDVQIGKGNIIYPGVSINHGSRIADFCVINMNCALGHDAKLGDYCALSPGVNLGGVTVMGKGVFMGIGATTNHFLTIGDFAIIGGQAMIIENIPEGVTVVGVPGKIVLSKKSS
ncbi:MAG: NeuD/PglB/VioB family sugar acetyltransferase [Bacteroidia bacterium]